MRLRHAAGGLHVVQKPHPFLHVGHHVPCNTWPRCRYARQNSPSKPKDTNFGVFSARWANFFAFTHTPSQAGRKTSRTGRSDVATLKPTTPLQPLMQASMKPPSPMLAPKQQPLKPPSPLQPKTTPKTPISHPQRRRRFQLAHLNGPQRRRRFQLRLGLSEQRRRRFHARDFRCKRAMASPDQHTFACNSTADTSRLSMQSLKFRAF